MIKKYKKVFLTAFALTCVVGLTYSINLKYNSIANKDKVLARESTPDKGDGGTTEPDGTTLIPSSGLVITYPPDKCSVNNDNVVLTPYDKYDDPRIGTWSIATCKANNVTATVTCDGSFGKVTFPVKCGKDSAPNTSGSSTAPQGTTSDRKENYSLAADSDRVSISEFAEKEVTLDPPSRATNTVTGTCEDYIVTEEGSILFC